jgi:hypothetical protein
MKVWKVQNKSFPEIDPGLVFDPYGFGDSPDAEAISSGLNSKGPDAVALGSSGRCRSGLVSHRIVYGLPRYNRLVPADEGTIR